MWPSGPHGSTLHPSPARLCCSEARRLDWRAFCAAAFGGAEMNMRKLLLLSFVVLLVCQLGFAQIAPNRTMASKAITAVQTTGKPVPVVPRTTFNGTAKARPTIWLSRTLGARPKIVAGEPSFCDFNTPYQIAVCAKGV